MKVLGLIGALVLMAACNNTAPTATGYKQQLGGGAATGGGITSQNATTGGGGDATQGKALFTSNGCVGCHAKGASNEFTAAVTVDATAQAKSPVHASMGASFTGANAANITAYIKTLFPAAGGAAGGGAGDAAAGETALKAAGCETACHKIDGSGVGPALDAFASFDGQESNPSHAGVVANFTDATKKANIIAALKARPAALK